MRDLERQLKGWRLVSLHIYYRMPDHPDVLQSFLHQLYDYPPEYPSARSFLDFWEERLDGPIHSVEMATKDLVGPSEFRRVNGVWKLH